MNTAMQGSTKVSPEFLTYGRHPRQVKCLRCEVEIGRPVLRIEPEVWIDMVKRLDALRDVVAKYIEQAKMK